MVPHGILSGLGRLRRRERFVRLFVGAAKFVALVAVVILAGCLIDWFWDQSADTPRLLRQILLGVTATAAVIGFAVWLVWPQMQRLRDDDLALWVEREHPTFRNRLISAVQLNRPAADKRGMSVELIAIMTTEAETRARDVSFARIADHSRLGTAAKLLIPVAIVAAGLFAWQPHIVPALFARHFLADVEIPRRTRLQPIQLAQVAPAGEKVTIAFEVTGEGFDESTVGQVDVTPEGQPRDRYPLTFSHNDPKTGAAIFSIEAAPSSTNLNYTARLGDGRMKQPGQIRIVPRPAIIEQTAYTVLPAYCGLRPSGGRYEVPQGRGDVAGIPGSAAKIVVKTQKPITKARIEILGPESVDPNKSSDDLGPEVLRRTEECQIGEDKESAVGTFDLKPDESGYRVVVVDEYGFENVPLTRRNVRIVPEEAPTVVLLKDYFTPGKVGAKESLEDFHIEGMPIPIGEVMRVPYLAEGPYGLGQAWFLYRVLKKTESGGEIVEEDPYRRLPLPEVTGSAKTGPFDPRRGVFQNTPPDRGVEFVALPSPDPERILGRTLGGGRFHFKTTGIPDGKGGVLKLEDGDRIEYLIEIHADKGTTPGRPIARSEPRVQVLGTYEGLGRWIADIAQEERRLRELDGKQRTLFANP